MFWRRRARLDEEIRSHLAEETADNIARGMDPVQARDALCGPSAMWQARRKRRGNSILCTGSTRCGRMPASRFVWSRATHGLARRSSRH